MPTTIRVEDDVKRELDRFQGDLLAERGERLSHSEILERLLRFVRARDAEFFERGEARTPTREELARLLDRAPDVRLRARARDVDRTLYGRRP